MGAVGLQAGDYDMAGFDEADLVITVGFDLVEHSPEHWNPERDKRIVYIDTVAVEVDEFFVTDVDLVGDLNRILELLTEECARRWTHPRSPPACATWCWAASRPPRSDDHFPMQPPRALYGRSARCSAATTS